MLTALYALSFFIVGFAWGKFQPRTPAGMGDCERLSMRISNDRGAVVATIFLCA